MNKSSFKTGLWITLAIILITLVTLVSQGFTISSLSGKPSIVYVPSYSTLSCEQTRIEYYPEALSQITWQSENVPSSGYSYWCGSPTLSNSYYAKGCDVFLTSTGLFDRETKICNNAGTNCQSLTSSQATNTWTTGSKSLHLNYNEKLYIGSKGLLSVDYKIKISAPVYGIRIEGSGIKPSYSNNCNLQSLLSDRAIAVLKNNPDYSKILATSQIAEGVFPSVFITGYTQSYKDMRVISKDGFWYFVEDIGYICTIEQGSDGLYYVSNNCKSDSTIECYPLVGNCDDNGKLITTPPKTCTAGTLIGSTGGRKNIYGDQACYLKCNSQGVPELTDCTTVSKCSAGYTWNQNYECIKTEDANAKSICEANNGVFVTKSDGSTYCDKVTQDLTTIYIILGIFAGLIIILLIAMYRNKK